MVQLLVIVIFVAIAVDREASWHALASDSTAARAWGIGLALAGFASLAVSIHLLIWDCIRRLDRSGRVRHVLRGDRVLFAGRVALAVWFVIALSILGWGQHVQAVLGPAGRWPALPDFAIALPALMVLVAGWWSFYPLERRMREAVLWRRLHDGRPVHRPWTRGEYVWSCFRHQVLLVLVPVTGISCWNRGLELWSGESVESGSSWILPVLQLTGTVAIFALMPLVMRFIWDTTPMPAGLLRERLFDVCRRHSVRIAELLVWRTNGTIINGAVMGIVGPARYIMLTDALLESLAPEQIEAVTAHEVGHVRRRHLIWLILATAAAVLGSAYVLEAAVEPGAAVNGWLGTVISLVAGVGTFGFVSRRFEWQADAFAAADMSTCIALPTMYSLAAPGEQSENSSDSRDTLATVTPSGVAAMVGALTAVSELNGIPLAKPSWRHGSIAERQIRLKSLVNRRLAALPIDRQVRLIKFAVALVLAAVVALQVVGLARSG